MAIEHSQEGKIRIKAWTEGVPVDAGALAQLHQAASLPFVRPWVAAMPDVHIGIGATVGSVIPTVGAIIPAAVGVDIGCGMIATRTTLRATDLPDNLAKVRAAIENAVPHGRSGNGGRSDTGAWSNLPSGVVDAWAALEPGFQKLTDKHPKFKSANTANHLGTLGTGNHFVEVCLDEEGWVWFMLHSGSRGVGNAIGSYFIELARKDQEHHIANLPDKNLAYFEEGAEHFDDYCEAVGWAQAFAGENRRLMMEAVITAVQKCRLPAFEANVVAVNCHHNYVNRETHFGTDVWVTRKGAVSAREGELGIIPGSMGAKSFIVRGKGNPDSFSSCSHGAGRRLSRTAAKKAYTLDDHIRATEGIECRKDVNVIDETPMAYKDIDAVMAAQSDLVDIVHTLRQVVCVKG